MKRVRGCFYVSLILGAMLTMPGCVGSVEENFGQIESAIDNGTIAPWASPYDAVVSLHYLSEGKIGVTPMCTGTLIDEYTVVTAAHCLIKKCIKVGDISNPDPSDFLYGTCQKHPDNIGVFIGNNVYDFVQYGFLPVRAVDSIFLPSEYLSGSFSTEIREKAETNHAYDVAIIKLKTSSSLSGVLRATKVNPLLIIPPVLTFPKLPTNTGFFSPTDRITRVVGFGIDPTSGETDELEALSSGVKRYTLVEITGIDSYYLRYSAPFGGPAAGDSGGPSLKLMCRESSLTEKDILGTGDVYDTGDVLGIKDVFGTDGVLGIGDIPDIGDEPSIRDVPSLGDEPSTEDVLGSEVDYTRDRLDYCQWYLPGVLSTSNSEYTSGTINLTEAHLDFLNNPEDEPGNTNIGPAAYDPTLPDEDDITRAMIIYTFR